MPKHLRDDRITTSAEKDLERLNRHYASSAQKPQVSSLPTTYFRRAIISEGINNTLCTCLVAIVRHPVLSEVVDGAEWGGATHDPRLLLGVGVVPNTADSVGPDTDDTA